MGRFPLKDFYDQGFKPISDKAWISYFYQVSMLASGRWEIYPKLEILGQAWWLLLSALAAKFVPKQFPGRLYLSGIFEGHGSKGKVLWVATCVGTGGLRIAHISYI